MSVTALRNNIQTTLATGLGLEAQAFPTEGPIQDRDLIAVWVEGVREVGGAIQEQTVHVRARVFKLWQPPTDQTAPPDVAPLEDLLEQVQTVLKPEQVDQTATGVWMFRTVNVQIVYEQWAVEAEIVGWRLNPFLP